ncbi:MAG: hypothetical protein J5492_00865 [Oxalobacter sp.]|nr:hypothetical protein [Oxalobacter sp.]
MMTKTLLAAVALGLMTGNVIAGTSVFQTSKHNIRISCPFTDNANTCTYESWNKPKRIGQGKPDFSMQGVVGFGYMRDCTDPNHCLASCDIFTFTKGNISLKMQGSDENIGSRCASSPKAPTKVWGDMTIKINNQVKDHYWIYSK